ncbi:MAG: 50S ribosomal protein L3 [Myxococcales bacterium]|nr:50S ribosomal protein L3 [Myxococcales bacterium]
MHKGLFGRKIGMTQTFDSEGNKVAVTVLEVGPCPVVRVKTTNGKDGYDAIVIGFGARKPKHTTKPYGGQFKAAGIEPTLHLREMRVTANDVDGVEAGLVLDAAAFSVGQKVDVVARTKGRGFTGVIKRHNFHMPKASHGTHEVFRHGGSLGTRTTPGRVFLGKKMAGRYGFERVTAQNLTVTQVDVTQNLVVVRGSVPGPNGAVVWIQEAVRTVK